MMLRSGGTRPHRTLREQQPPGDSAPARFARLDRLPFPAFDPGSVWLVGAGPGAVGLITLMGYHALGAADVIIYDALVNPSVLDWARPDAVREYAGKRGGKPSPGQRDITLKLIEHARAGRRVLRLKGGDPFMFGRGGEECEALSAAGVPFRVVPGVSAGLGGLAYAGLPVTHREANQAVTFLTGHDVSGALPTAIDWPALARGAPVLVMYMAARHLPEIAARLLSAGRDGSEPVAIVAHASLPSQVVVTSTLGQIDTLVAEEPLPTPAIIVVGPVVRLQDRLDWFTAKLRDNPIG